MVRFNLNNFTIKKAINYLKIQISIKLGLTKVWGKPYILMLEPTNICNLSCPLCPTGNKTLKRKKGYMDFDNFKKIVDKLSDTLIEIVLWNFGEPFLNKDIYKFIKYAKDKKIQVITSTNGHFFKTEQDINNLFESGLDYLIIALDGASDETLSKYRLNSNFQQIINGIKNIVAEKNKRNLKNPVIELQFIAMKHNEHEIPDIQKLAKELQIDKLKIKTVSIRKGYDSEKYLPTNQKIIRKDVDTAKCSFLRKTLVVNWDGSTLPCCLDWYDEYPMGNILGIPLEQLWNSKKYRTFRKGNNEHKILLCNNCNSVNQLISKDY